MATGIGFCVLGYHIRAREYELLRALGVASCDIIYEPWSTSCYRHRITHETRGTSCYGHWVLRLVISHTKQGATIRYRHWVLRLVISHTGRGVRLVTGIGFGAL